MCNTITLIVHVLQLNCYYNNIYWKWSKGMHLIRFHIHSNSIRLNRNDKQQSDRIEQLTKMSRSTSSIKLFWFSKRIGGINFAYFQWVLSSSSKCNKPTKIYCYYRLLSELLISIIFYLIYFMNLGLRSLFRILIM